MTYSNADFTPGLKGYTDIKPFRFWCQKVLPIVYDDSLSYYELLCKVTDYINNIITDLATTEENVGSLLDAYNQLQDYVNNYFTNLDVQEEINNHLDDLVEDGTLTRLIGNYVQPYIDDFQEQMDNYETHLNGEFDSFTTQTSGNMQAQNDRIAVLEGRMDTFSQLTQGSTTADAELQDIRVAYNGKIYQTAGDSVRGQVQGIHNNDKYNSVDLLPQFATYNNITSGGVTYSWNADNTVCTAIGTTTTTSVTNLYNENTLPSGMENDKKYYIKIDTSNPNLLLEINAYNVNTSLSDLFLSEDTEYVVPTNATRLLIRIRTRHTSANPSTVNDTISVKILTAKTNTELNEAIKNLNTTLNNDVNAIEEELKIPCKDFMQIFPKYTTIGDSLMGGFMNRNGVSVNTVTARDAGNNWVNYIALRTGRTFTNLAVGGSTAKQWRESLLTSANIDTDCYIIGIGVNDHRDRLTIGDSSDIKTDYTENSDTFYGNYDYMLRQLMAWKPNAHIFCFTIPEIEGGTSGNYNTAIKNICALYTSKVHCIDLATDWSDYYDNPVITDNYSGRHFNPVAYNYMSSIIEKAINLFIMNNDELFATAPYA